MVPSASIQISVLATRDEGGVVGSWIPTLIGSECVRADDWRPWTNGERAAGRHSEMDSAADEAM
jgi:hypothetical protein